jgi:hypothetical protein
MNHQFWVVPYLGVTHVKIPAAIQELGLEVRHGSFKFRKEQQEYKFMRAYDKLRAELPFITRSFYHTATPPFFLELDDAYTEWRPRLRVVFHRAGPLALFYLLVWFNTPPPEAYPYYDPVAVFTKNYGYFP